MTNPSTIGQYTIMRELGRGGMSTVYLAHDPRFDREVAIKVLPRQFLHDPNFRTRFEREAKTIAALEHPAIVPVYDFGEEGDQPYLVMRYMLGGSLEDRIKQGPISLEETRRIFERLASALEEAHEQGIVHRDLKPGNILFDHRGNPYLGDFGIVKLMTESGTLTGTAIIGTPAYMSPEQAQGKVNLDRRSDIYSLGVILFEMLTGRQPYQADTPMGLALAQINEPIPQIRDINREVSPAVQDVLSRSMAKNRDDRFSSVAELARGLREISDRPEAPGSPPPRAARPLPTPTPQPAPSTRIMDQAPAVPASGKKRPLPLTWILGIVVASLLVIGPVLYFTFWGGDGSGGGDNQETALVSPAAEEVAVAEPTHTSPPPPAETAAVSPTNTPRPTTVPATPTPEPQPTEVSGLVGGEAILTEALAGAYEGSSVTLIGALVDEAAGQFENTLADFEAQTGIEIRYSGANDYASQIDGLLQAGEPPDIGIYPQLSLAAGLVQEGRVIDPGAFLGQEFLEAHYAQGWLDDAARSGQMAGVWIRANLKSLVWYPKDDFDAAGYEIPRSWEGLLALSEQMAADGRTPWCIGLESGAATGWVATDWLEDIVLRTQPPEVYDAWVRGVLPFDSPEIGQALEIMGEIWQNPDFVLGGPAGITTISFFDSPLGMFDNPPSCWLHRQGDFMVGFFPPQAAFGQTYDFFYLPPIDLRLGEPMLVSGEIAVMFNDRPEVRAVMAYLATGESMRGWIEQGGIVAPHRDANPVWYANLFERRLAEQLRDATLTRFDASDQMPPQVGAGAFWSEMTDWAAGAPAGEILPAIDDAWPR